MASIAVIAATNVIIALTNGCCAIVATHASANDLVVIHCTTGYRCPVSGQRFMAGITQIGGINMCIRFTGGIRIVVTGNTVISEATVIDTGR